MPSAAQTVAKESGTALNNSSSPELQWMLIRVRAFVSSSLVRLFRSR